VRGNFACACGWEIDGPEDFGFVREDELDNVFAPIRSYEE
jgi:hypothetical protein